jgi:hypothetical protein
MPEGKVFLDDVATEVLVEGELSSLAGVLGLPRVHVVTVILSTFLTTCNEQLALKSLRDGRWSHMAWVCSCP